MIKILNSKFYILIAILIIAAFFRLYNITELPPGLYPDEAMNGNNALEANWKIFYPENNGREGLFMNIQTVFLKVLMPLSGGNPEPWMLRFPSAIFGILTVLGIYFLTKELFRENPKSKILNPKQIQKSNDQNPKQFRISNFEFRISRSQKIALLSSFFLATSFWHINFSRIGFRAIMAPFFLTWAVYFLLVALRTTNDEFQTSSFKFQAIAGGIFFGLGFYSYIAYRIMPLLIAIIFFYYFYQHREHAKKLWAAISIYVIAAFIIALPIGIYFLKNSADFFGRTVQVSIGVFQSPIGDLAMNTVKTLGMFNFVGDGNWRHNYAGRPELFWPVGILFVIGVILGIRQLLKFQIPSAKLQTISNNRNSNGQNVSNSELGFVILFSWLIIAVLPVIISNEGLPHALRAILMAPPIFILAGLGGIWLYEKIVEKLQKYTKIPRLLLLSTFYFLLSLFIFEAYTTYFVLWGKNPNAQGAFAADYVQIGKRLNALPKELPKYVLVEAGGVNVRGIPMPTQTVMFITDTFTPEKQKEKNIFYVLPDKFSQVPQNAYTVVIK